MEIIVFFTLFVEELKEEQTKIDKVVSDGWKYLGFENEIIDTRNEKKLICRKYVFSKTL